VNSNSHILILQPTIICLQYVFMGSTEAKTLKKHSEGRAEEFARQQHRCQPVGVMADR
jgi:hypothetical protein